MNLSQTLHAGISWHSDLKAVSGLKSDFVFQAFHGVQQPAILISAVGLIIALRGCSIPGQVKSTVSLK